MLFLTEENDLRLTPKLQVLYFYATWMTYHKKMLSMLNKLEKKYPAIEFFAVDIDFFKNFIKRFNVDSIPTIIILNNGKEIKRVKGLVLTSALNAVFVDIYKFDIANFKENYEK